MPGTESNSFELVVVNQWVVESERSARTVKYTVSSAGGLFDSEKMSFSHPVARSKVLAAKGSCGLLHGGACRFWPSGCIGAPSSFRAVRSFNCFTPDLRVATRRRRAEKIDADTLHRVPSARTIARLMTLDRNDLSKADTVTVAAVKPACHLSSMRAASSKVFTS